MKSMISNLVLNASRQDIIMNKQFEINNKEYSLGKDLYAMIDRGANCLSQEDAVLLLKHPNNKDFKLIAVADGDSSKSYGEEASNYVLYSIINWFENLDSTYFNNIKELKKIVEKRLDIINSELILSHNGNATTIALAIIGKNDTLISSIGDSRIYLIKDNKIVEETKDDSYVQKLCDIGLADPKKARFYKAINVLNSELGTTINNNLISEKTNIVPNDYDKLLILSDGVTRLVDNDKIERTFEKNNDKEIIKELIRIAKTENIYMDGIDLYCNNEIKANQNNMTAAMYIKRR